MAIITYPLNNIEYTAEDAELYHATRTSGVFANDDFPITVPGGSNAVTIGDGIGWIRNSKFSGKVVANKSEMSLDLGLSHATYPRIDAVVLQFNANSNATEIIVKNGTAKTNPMPPEVVRTESVYELHLYHVYRPAGSVGVVASNVTDLRPNDTYCGLMKDDVTMLSGEYIGKNMIGVANGIASLDSSGKVPEGQIPETYLKVSQLSSSVTSPSATTPASSAAVKEAYDVASGKASSAMGTVMVSQEGPYNAPTLLSGGWSKVGNIVQFDIKIDTGYTSDSKVSEYSFIVDGHPAPSIAPCSSLAIAGGAVCYAYLYAGGVALYGINAEATIYGTAHITFSYLSD